MKDPRPLGQKREFFLRPQPRGFHAHSEFLSDRQTSLSKGCVWGHCFEEELNFWGLDEKQIETCCWAKYDETS